MKKTLLELGLFLVCIGFMPPPLLAQAKRPVDQQVGHDYWGFKEGAPQSVESIAQTTDGLLWFGTQSGLYRFDGIRFDLFRSPFGDQFLSTYISALFAPKSGGLWIGYEFGGFSFLKDGRITNYGQEIAVPSGTVWNFAQNTDGVLWAATNSGLWRFGPSSWQHIEPEFKLAAGPIHDARFDKNGTLWALTGNILGPAAKQLVRLRSGGSQFQVVANDVPVVGFTLDADGWVVTSPRRKQIPGSSEVESGDLPSIYPVLKNGSESLVDRQNGVWIMSLKSTFLKCAAASSEGAAIAGALDKASPHSCEVYNPSLNLLAKVIDREGNLWLGDNNGVHRFFYHSLINQELPNSERYSYFSVVSGDNGAVWVTVGTDNTDLFRVENGQVKARYSLRGYVGLTYSGPDGAVWLGGLNGLWRLAHGSLARVSIPKEMADQSGFLQTITQDHNGGMWVSFGRHGLYRFADNVWTPYGGHDELPKTGVVSEFTDSLGRVWFGYTRSQLAVLDGEHVRVFGTADGIRLGNITAIYGRGPEIWIGGEFGLQQFDHGRFHAIQATDSTFLRGISGIVETLNGDLWLNGLGGIFHIRRGEIVEALKDPAYQVRGEHLGPREGLPGYPSQIRLLNTAIEGADGKIWFATSGGIVSVDPARFRITVPAPPVTIQSFSADEKNYPLASKLKLPANTSSVQINYSAVSLSDPLAVHSRYKLREIDRDWHEVASVSPVTYRNLPPGSYHFIVMATDTNGVWPTEGVTAEFTILPAFYQTRWFLLVFATVLIGLIWLAIRLRIRRLAGQIRERAEVRADERVRIARDLHDTLLQGVQGLTLHFHVAAQELPEGSRTRESMERALATADRILVEGRDRVKRLRAEDLTHSDVTEAFEAVAADLNYEQRVRFALSVEGRLQDVTSPVLHELYYIGREAISNAFRHAKPSDVTVKVRCGPKSVVLAVTDNGCGFDSAAQEANPRTGHWGLQGMRERAEAVGARFQCQSAEGKGTEINVIVPARRAYQKPSAVGNGSHLLFD